MLGYHMLESYYMDKLVEKVNRFEFELDIDEKVVDVQFIQPKRELDPYKAIVRVKHRGSPGWGGLV